MGRGWAQGGACMCGRVASDARDVGAPRCRPAHGTSLAAARLRPTRLDLLSRVPLRAALA